MVAFLSMILLGLAISLDSFSVGFTYGLRNMRLPFKSLLIIALCTMTTMAVSLFVGNLVLIVFSPEFSKKLGGIILIALGCFLFVQQLKAKLINNDKKVLVDIEIKSLGIVINILKKPLMADFDKSGTITGVEALFLGLALSLDAFGVGISAALFNYNPILLIAIVTIMSSSLVLLGINSGKVFSENILMKKFLYLPSLLLILIGISKL